MASPTNPLETARAAFDASVSSRTFVIAGILVTVQGLAELPSNVKSVACLWLLHPRLSSREHMAYLGDRTIRAWNAHHRTNTKSTTGLIAVAFDQRNHGSRQVDKLHNEAWRQGNPRHAQDMFSCYNGTAHDVSHLISHLESYIFIDPNGPQITQNLVMGVSLGGHASWHLILSDPRITAAVVGIGCPDYMRLMTDRARLSKRETYTKSSPPGSKFLGSKDFPQALIDAIEQADPAGLLLPGSFDPLRPNVLHPAPDKAKLDRARVEIRKRLHGKRILALSGKADKLVPYAAGEPFLKVFKQLIKEDPSLDFEFEDVLFEGVGHSFPKAMADKTVSWVCDLLTRNDGAISSKM